MPPSHTHSHTFSTNCETKLILYQMIFAEKLSPIKSSQVAYKSFQSCGPRMEYALTPTPSVPNPFSSVGTKLLKCATPLRYRNGHGAEGMSCTRGTELILGTLFKLCL